MKVGTRSLLFGIHQFIWHPIVVYKAWSYLYDARPTWKELVCIIIHDWGYWGKPNLDGEEGIEHPRIGANIAYKLYGVEHWRLCAGHSRSYVALINSRLDEKNISTSKLCWADKLSFCFEPAWFYLFRATLSGELKEIYDISIVNGIIKEGATKKEWTKAMYEYCKNQPEIIDIIEHRYGRSIL